MSCIVSYFTSEGVTNYLFTTSLYGPRNAENLPMNREADHFYIKSLVFPWNVNIESILIFESSRVRHFAEEIQESPKG